MSKVTVTFGTGILLLPLYRVIDRIKFVKYNFLMSNESMEHQIKKTWGKPALIRLIKSSREEVVLISCKMPDGAEFTTGPASEFSPCGSIPCDVCSTIVAS
jgi:hypothetical protein